jgi:hypothetical protein
MDVMNRYPEKPASNSSLNVTYHRLNEFDGSDRQESILKNEYTPLTWLETLQVLISHGDK